MTENLKAFFLSLLSHPHPPLPPSSLLFFKALVHTQNNGTRDIIFQDDFFLFQGKLFQLSVVIVQGD